MELQQQQSAQNAEQIADNVSYKLETLRLEIVADAVKAITPALKDLERQIANQPSSPVGKAIQEPQWVNSRTPLCFALTFRQ